ncbi:unnamed protein product [Absidia cylindrospora]
MKPSIPFTRLNKSPDAIRWFIVGAHQAGASHNEIASLTNFSRQTVWHVINSFKRTGMPNGRRRKRTDTKKPLSYYDARSELQQDSSDSCSDDQHDFQMVILTWTWISRKKNRMKNTWLGNRRSISDEKAIQPLLIR